MILFINTFITDTTIPGQSPQRKLNNRKFLKSYSSLDVFKYSLATLSEAYNWKKILLKISLDDNYLNRKDELETFINDEFKNIPTYVSWNRNVYQKDWQETYELLDDDLIWFSCNHDHIFLDSSQYYLNFLVNEMMKEADSHISLCYTHWPEQAAYLSKNKSPNDLKIYDKYATMNFVTVDSINIISKSLYKLWWFSSKLPDDMRFPRPDWGQNMLSWFINTNRYQKSFIPLKELCRHFDAYYHLDMHQCPALNIPDGFFDKNINISVGNPERIEGYTWFNPMITKYRAENEIGVDYKWSNEDIPLGWHNRCKDIKILSYPDNWYDFRMKAITDMLYTHYETRMVFDQTILNKILNVWMHPYGLTTE